MIGIRAGDANRKRRNRGQGRAMAETAERTLIERIEDWLCGPPGLRQFWRIPFKAVRYLHRQGWRSAVLLVMPSLRRYGVWFRFYGRPSRADIAGIKRHI